MFRFLHKDLKDEELSNIKEIERDLITLRPLLDQAHQIITLFISRPTKDSTELDTRLKRILMESERILKKMRVHDHQAIQEEKKRETEKHGAQRKEQEFFEKIEANYPIKIGQYDHRAGAIEILDKEGNHMSIIHLRSHMSPVIYAPNMNGFEEDLILLMHEHGLPIPSERVIGFKIHYKGNAQHRLQKMGVRIAGEQMHTPQGRYDLNAGTPTKEITFSPDTSSDSVVLMEVINIKNKRSRYRIIDGNLAEA
jgi:hypothetical protein